MRHRRTAHDYRLAGGVRVGGRDRARNHDVEDDVGRKVPSHSPLPGRWPDCSVRTVRRTVEREPSLTPTMS
jgi:hypothetical protein